MIPIRSFANVYRRLSSFAGRVPPLLSHLWLAMLLHGLAGLCLAPLHAAVARLPSLVIALLLVSLVTWVVPKARPRMLARVGEALVAAGAAVAVVFAIATCARLVALG